jgi:hypothetical protein
VEKGLTDDTVESADAYYARKEVKLVIPDELKLKLATDWTQITKNNKVSFFSFVFFFFCLLTGSV